MRVQFWGVRGSIPTPLSPQEVESKVIAMAEDVVRAGITNPEQVAGYLRENHSMLVRGTVGGNTTCLSVEWPGATIVLDAGSGIRQLGRSLMGKGDFGRGKGEIHLLITHTHWDHMQGFPFFGPVWQRNTIHIHGGHDNLKRRFVDQQSSEFFPMPLENLPANLHFHQIETGKKYDLPGGGGFTAKRLNHPGNTYGYRIDQNGGSMVFATDCEYRRDDADGITEMVEFCRDADLLVFDSQYTLEESLVKEDWGHSTAIVGVDIAVRAGVKRLALFHHEPNYPDEFIRDLLLKARQYTEATYPDTRLDLFVAIEGMDMTL